MSNTHTQFSSLISDLPFPPVYYTHSDLRSVRAEATNPLDDDDDIPSNLDSI